MKLLAIAIVCLSLVLAEETRKDSSSSVDELDVVELGKNDGETKSSDAQRKRDSGYSYTRPDRFSSSQRHESSGGIRGRIVTRYPSSQTIRPFNRYGPPKHSNSPLFGKPSAQYAPQHQYAASGFPNRRPQTSGHDFSSSQSGGQMQQGVPSPIRQHDFVTPSPIASQNNEPFNSNAAAYLPPRNQKLPGYSNSHVFSNEPNRPQAGEDDRIQMSSNQHQQQNFNNNFQSQNLLQPQHPVQPQISDAALFLAQNAQAISQLYETPATNVNYEPIPQLQTNNPNNQFQTFEVSNAAAQTQQLQDSRSWTGSLPSYASGILDPRQTLEQIQSQEKDRLISELQQALVSARGRGENPASSTSPRYAQTTGNYIQSQALLASLGTQINPSIGPQLDKPNRYNGHQRPFGSENTAFGASAQFPAAGSGATTTSGFPFTYGLPSTAATPAATQPPSTTTTATSTTTSTTAQRPLPVGGSAGDGSSQVGTSVSPAGSAPSAFPFPQYGGFVPTLIGTNLVANYPAYGTNFLGSSSFPSSSSSPSSPSSPHDPAQSSGSAPTHFGIPIPTPSTAGQGTSSSAAKPPFPQKPQTTSGQHPRPSGLPVHTIPLQPIQPIHPIAATPVHTIFPIAQPPLTQVHPVQSPLPATSGHHPTYGLQPAVVNPLLFKPVKAVYPLYYYPNLYQIQKPAQPTYPWSYAPTYAQPKPAQAWK